MHRNGTDRVFPAARTLLRRNIRAKNDRLWGGVELAASRPTAPPQWAAVQPRGLQMKYEGSDVNRMMANGLMGSNDKVKPEPTPASSYSPRPIGSSEAKPSLIKNDNADRGPSVISHSVQLTGSIETPDELHIYGTIKGNVRASALVIFKGGIVNGEVIADVVTVHGTVEGSIQGKKVHLVSTATVRGDVFHDVIGIDPGANFEGASKRIPAAAVVANDSASEAA
jgi:cytoskeletal protein CcmA (bactofilin family)